MILAIDFDGTICKHEFPGIGAGYQHVVESLINLRKQGVKLILWTCRNGVYLDEAITWCKDRGLEFDAVNDDVQDVKDSDFGRSKSRKVFANYYLDDRNISMTEFILMEEPRKG